MIGYVMLGGLIIAIVCIVRLIYVAASENKDEEVKK